MARANRRPKLASTAEHSSSSSSSSSPSATGTPPPVGDDEQQQHQPDFEKRARDLEIQNGSHQKEIEELRSKRSNSSVTPNDSMRKMKEGYLQKLNVLEEQVKELKKKQDVQSQLSMYRRKSEESTKHLQDEIQKLKAQKVQLQCKMKMESMQYRLCKASLEKEILQLKKEGRRNDYEMHKLLALNQRQKLVLQRKTKESSVATNRLRQLVESQKALLHMKAGSRKGNTSGIQLQAIEHELEVTSHISEICSEYEHQVEMMADEIMKIKEEAESLKQENLRHLLENKELECREDPELKDLKEDVVKLSCMLHKLEMPKAKFPPLEELQDLSQSSLSIGSSSEQSNTSTHKAETCENVAAKGENASAICCSCSKKSLCKTMKCQCRVARGSCGTSCGCSHTKCTNRSSLVAKLNETIPTQVDKGNGHLKCSGSADAEKVLDANDVTTLQSVNGDSVAVKPDEIIPREAAEGNSKCSGSAEAEKSSILDSKDATATLNATVTVPAETNDNCGLKKMPLYDIANTLMKTFASKHNQRRKRRN
ncbi:kinesin-like protein KIN-4C isoform X2 [Rhodamnia argentea]|uniref:Kinesin-like protein KIN-4C isoform X2 n=1 Tax=Rhodamnia argentea TaxID=178133 RepID=A0A8B8P460_9MYRT|nr:kinesin-like protein KIN-4C isoform X2 [Rhodamnia argentea]